MVEYAVVAEGLHENSSWVDSRISSHAMDWIYYSLANHHVATHIW